MSAGFTRGFLGLVYGWFKRSTGATHRGLNVAASDRSHMNITASDRGHMNVAASDRSHMTVTAGDRQG